MALKIRLSRIGTKHKPAYRVVVAEERSRRDGDAVDILGTYLPTAKGNPLQVKLDRVDYWTSKGARPTSTVHALVKRERRRQAAVASTAPAAEPEPVASAATEPPAEPAAS